VKQKESRVIFRSLHVSLLIVPCLHSSATDGKVISLKCYTSWHSRNYTIFTNTSNNTHQILRIDGYALPIPHVPYPNGPPPITSCHL